MNNKQKLIFLLALFQIFLIGLVFFTVNGLIMYVSAQSDASSYSYYNSPTTVVLAIAAAASVGAAIIGSAWALRTVATAAISAATEREGSITIPFLAMALSEALAVYGFIVAIMLWTKIPSPP